MSEVLELLKQEMAAIRQSVESRNNGGVVDPDALARQVAQLVSAQQQDVLDATATRPVFRGEVVGAPGVGGVSRGLVGAGKFAGQKVDDLLFVRNFLLGVHRLEPSKVRLPSKELNDTLERALRRFPRTKPFDLVDAAFWAWHDLRSGLDLRSLPPLPTVRKAGWTDERESPWKRMKQEMAV